MTKTTCKLLHDREHAARLLAIKVANYKNSNAIVVGVGPGGASVGSSLAKELNLGFEVVLCRQVKHPAHPDRTIGSVSDGMVVLDDDIQGIPQDFLIRQVANLRLEMERDYRLIYGNNTRPSFKYKTIIPVGDVLVTPNSLLAGLKVIQSQNPLRVIVAVPVVEPHVASEIAGEVNDLVFVHMGSGHMREQDFYDNYTPVDLMEIKKSITSVNAIAVNHIPALPLALLRQYGDSISV
jgi:predicted phosphoribosyltransferase